MGMVLWVFKNKLDTAWIFYQNETILNSNVPAQLKIFFFNDWMLDCTNRVNVVEQQALVKDGKL